MPLPKGVSAILLDIEGTTTPISFVYDVLFPYAREHLDEYCARADKDEAVAAAISQLREEASVESRVSGKEMPDFGNGAPFARYLMDMDRKSTGLKMLQGLIWEKGYAEGSLKSEVFDDVPVALKKWREAGIRLRIFSSGSVLAQKLLFGHTKFGDLLEHFEGYHDTTTGPKRVADSYRAIAGAFGLPESEILFLSDVVEELDAAAQAGMKTGLMVRPGNKEADPGVHPVHKSFQELTD